MATLCCSCGRSAVPAEDKALEMAQEWHLEEWRCGDCPGLCVHWLADRIRPLLAGSAKPTRGELWAKIHDQEIRAEKAEAERDEARAAIERIRSCWPHIEFPAGKYWLDRSTKDPGAPTCLRCKIEEAIRGDVR